MIEYTYDRRKTLCDNDNQSKERNTMFTNMMSRIKAMSSQEAKSERWERRQMLQSEKIQIQAASAPGANLQTFISR